MGEQHRQARDGCGEVCGKPRGWSRWSTTAGSSTRTEYGDTKPSSMRLQQVTPPAPSPSRAKCAKCLSIYRGARSSWTEQAPVPALIQRLGRLNRQAQEGDPTRPFVVLPLTPENYLPYAPSDMKASATWLARLPDGNISQRHLADAWEQTNENPPEPVASAWLDGGPQTTVSELREASARHHSYCA